MHLASLCVFLYMLGVCARLTIAQNICQPQTNPLIAEHSTCPPDEIRSIEEKQRLLARLSRSKGTWEARHPRYRLLEALRGFLKHHELVSKDVDRWRNLYRNVPKQQRKVWFNALGNFTW